MFLYKTCGICGLQAIHKDFLRDSETGEPKYFADKQFHPELTEDVIFCSAQHSLDWNNKNIDNKADSTVE